MNNRGNRLRAPRFSLRLTLIAVTAICVFAALRRERLRVATEGAWARVQNALVEKSKTPRADRIVLTSFIQPVGAPPLGPPSLDEVIAALQKKDGADRLGLNLRIVVEPVSSYDDPPRVYPTFGPMQLHHAHYRCMVYSDDGERTIYLDRNHFVRCGMAGELP